MKVLHLISGGDTGGAKTHLISLMKGLDKLADAKVICFIEDTFYEDLKSMGIKIEVFEQKSRSDMSVVNRLRDEILRENYDIVHCHGARANFIAMFLKRKIKTPMLTTIHSDYKLDFKDNFYKKLVFTSLNTIALKSFKYYIAISDTFKDMLIDRGFKEDRIYVAYNGIDLDKPEDIVPRPEFLNKFGIVDRGKTLVGIVARLDGVKDHDTFIDGAAKLLEKRDDVEFLIAGEGNNEERLKDKVKSLNLEDKIHFLGFVEDQYSLFNAMDINTLTSISESFPYVIMEGAKMKKTIVSTRVGGVANLIRDNETGFLIDVGDSDGLRDRLDYLLDHKDRIDLMGENLYSLVREKYSSEAMAKTHLDIYQEIIERWRSK